jgi:hypothetical protein
MHYSDRPHATSDEQVKFGVIGYGYWGPNLVCNFANTDGCHVVGVSDLDASNLMPCIRPYPGVTITDFRDLIENRRIDAVAIATPAHRNFELNMAALRARKHVIVENPLVQTSDQVCRLIDEAKRRKLTLMIDHTFVYTPAGAENSPTDFRRRFGGDILLQWHLREPRIFPERYQCDLGPRGARLIQYPVHLRGACDRFSHRGDPFPRDAGKHGAHHPVLRGQLRGAYQRHLAFADQGAANLQSRRPQDDRL